MTQAKTVVVNQKPTFTRLAVFHGKTPQDFFVDKHSDLMRLNAIHYGRVVSQSSQGAFVDIGLKRPGFLGLEKGFSTPRVGEKMLVQVSREPYLDAGESVLNDHQKGAKLTRNISLAGRYVIYFPLTKTPSSISKKLSYSAQGEFEAILEQHPISFSIREAAAAVSQKVVQDEIAGLVKTFEGIQAADKGCAFEGTTNLGRLLRDADSDDEFIFDDASLMADIKAKHPSSATLTLAKETQKPVYDHFGVEDVWQEAMESTVHLPSGGNITIQSTAVCHVIDVNQGDKTPQQANAEAVPVIAAQIHRRNLGGNIIIDFIDAKKPEQLKLEKRLRDSIKKDPTHTRVMGWSKTGWLEVRRDRRQASLTDKLMSACKNCAGSGKAEND